MKEAERTRLQKRGGVKEARNLRLRGGGGGGQEGETRERERERERDGNY